MHSAELHITPPSELLEAACSGPLHAALEGIAALGGGRLRISDQTAAKKTVAAATAEAELCVQYRGASAGSICFSPSDAASPIAGAARVAAPLLEHALDRERAVADLSDALIAGYDELNLLYALLPEIATRTDAHEIGELLVERTAAMLNCRRVSLLVLDEDRRYLRVLAARGLPPEAIAARVPVADTIAGHALLHDELLIVDDIAQRPDLRELSRGVYDTNAFSIVRVPLQAAGDPVGVLTVTERAGDAEFTARDRKLLEGLSAVGASALLNCRLHATLSRQMLQTIRALASAVDAKDHYTHDHSGRVAQLCLATAEELGIVDAGARRELELAGLLHDIGKIAIPDSILEKTGPLAPDELALVRTHPDVGARIVAHVPGLERVARAIRHHHERYAGGGYPFGLLGEQIPHESRIIAVADVFDCLTSDRPYRQGVGTRAALQEMQRCRATQFDPVVLDVFAATVERRADAPEPPTSDAAGAESQAARLYGF